MIATNVFLQSVNLTNCSNNYSFTTILDELILVLYTNHFFCYLFDVFLFYKTGLNKLVFCYTLFFIKLIFVNLKQSKKMKQKNII